MAEPEEPKHDRPDAAQVDQLSVRAQDEDGAVLQLAARWAEKYTPSGTSDDRPDTLLRRFRTNLEYIDCVIHGIKPPEIGE
jgi:hypothetical protein